MFGEQTSAVLHSNIQSPPVELHEGNRELKPEQTERGRARSTFTTQQSLSHIEIQEKSEQWDSRLIVNRVEGFLERMSFPPARPPFVRQQVEADVRI